MEKVVEKIASEYPDVALNFFIRRYAAMQIILNPNLM
jgi:isocitrate/isopropylmalate dehydrogenase